MSVYGRITLKFPKVKEMEICNIIYNILHPIDIIFNSIDDLLELSTMAGMQILTILAINLTYVVFTKILFFYKILEVGTSVLKMK